MKYTDLKTGDRFRFTGKATKDRGHLTPVFLVVNTHPQLPITPRSTDKENTGRYWTALYGEKAGTIFQFDKTDTVEKL